MQCGRGATETFVAQVKKRIRAAVSLPAGSYIEFTGTAHAAARARRQLLFRALLAGLGIVLLLSVTLHHYRNVLLVLLNLPFALVGGVGILLLTGTILSLGAMVGFITLFGITLRNSLMLISHYEHLVAEEAATWSATTARRGAAERLAPILMTALVTGLGLLPLVIGLHTAGREIEGPMALVILGGLTSQPPSPAHPGGTLGSVSQAGIRRNRLNVVASSARSWPVPPPGKSSVLLGDTSRDERIAH